MARPKKRWTPKEDAFLRDHVQEMTTEELAKALKRSIHSVYCRKGILGITNLGPVNRDWNTRTARPDCKNHCKAWSAEEEVYLEENWGTISAPTMAKNLGRTVESVKIRAGRLGLGRTLVSGDYITYNQLIRVFQGKENAGGYQMTSWIKERGFPIHTKRVDTTSFRVVYLDEFWTWAEKHRSFLDFSRMEPLALGEEPPWVEQQRKIDAVSFANQRKDPWTPQEEQRLIYLLKKHKYTWAEISKELKRSAGAIQRRCCDLGLKERPLRESPHNPWSDSDRQLMAEMIRQGYSWSMIGEACGGRSEKAVRGVAFQKYHTENMDKIRAMLGDGSWGHGAPEPTVKSEKHKEIVKKPVRRLCELLLIRRNELGWDEFWQRDMCQNWDDVRGCLMKSPNCDDCTKFQRIRPQYCRMCGGEFLERQEQTFCRKCRTMRKKQAQRKYAVLHARGRL